MIEVNYENFIKLLDENPTLETIMKKRTKVKDSIDKIKSGGLIYIWPYSRLGETVHKELQCNGYENIKLIDKNKEIEGVISPDEVIFNKDDILIIATSVYYNEIYNLANEMNCKHILVFYDIKDLGVDAPIIFSDDFCGKCFEGLAIHLLENVEKYKNMYFCLEDEISRKSFLNNMFFRLTLDMRYNFEKDEGIPYFDDSIIEFNSEDIIIDGGGYNGDTLEQFLKLNKQFKSYYLFEPDKDLINHAKHITQDKRVHYINKGLFCREDILRFNKSKTETGRITEDGDCTVDVTSIDEYFKQAITFIKMDIEGSELEALKGAKGIITKYEPTLAICIYHKSTDYLDIFEYIKGLNPNYKFLLRHHINYYGDTVLYAISKNNNYKA